MTGVATVIGKAERAGTPWYFLDDGVYNSFSGILYDHTNYPIAVSRRGPTRESVLAGPTCDSIDVIAEGIQLPELEIGDLIVAPMMGAYTSASATEFNSFPKTKILALNAPRYGSNLLRLARPPGNSSSPHLDVVQSWRSRV
jgi:ornithine decarboxylase